MGSHGDTTKTSSSPIKLPVINISKGGVQTARELVDAATTYGFLYVDPAGTGLTPSNVGRAFQLSREFFARPREEKEKFPMDTRNRGWAGTNNETLDPQNQRRPDMKEVFNFGEFDYNGQLDQDLPEVFEKTRGEIREFQAICEKTCHRILDLIGQGLEVEEDAFFSKRHTKPSASTFRMLYYPTVSDDETWDDAVDVRAGAHSDYGSVTLLFQQLGQPGLEIRTPEDDSWAPVAVVPDGYACQDGLPPILVNLADLMTYWTNGLLRSTVHRVIFPKGGSKREDRYSVVYFCNPGDDMELVGVPSRIVKARGELADGVEVGYGGGSAKKRALTAREHFLNRIQATYSFRKTAEASG